MIITNELDIEYSEEFNTAISQFAITLGDEIKDLGPLEQFYAIKAMSEKLEGLVSIYVLLGRRKMENASEEDRV